MSQLRNNRHLVVEEPGSTTKKTPTPQDSRQGLPKVPSNLDGGRTSLYVVGYIPFFNDKKVDELAKKVAELEKAKAESDEELKATKEKLNQVEAENVKGIADLRADKENKSKQIEMLYVREQQPDVEVNVENALVLAQHFILVGEVKRVSYSREDNARRIEVERRRLKAKQAKKTQTVEKVDEENDDEDEEDDDLKDIDNYHRSSDDDNGDDDDQGGNGGALVVRSTTDQQNLDFLDDTQNEEQEEVHRQGESSGEIVENWTRESMKEALGLNDEDKLTFDFEKDIKDNGPDGEYVFERVDEADNFNNVVTEDGSDSDNEVPVHYAGQDADFPTFVELFRSHNEEHLRRKVGEESISKKLSEEELREERTKWYKLMPGV
ncbi:hypothetical protein Hanom_Chr09g00776161 [Helianthus anomalus]